MADETPKRGMDWVTPLPKPNIHDLLVELGFTTFGDDAIRTSLKELIELRKQVSYIGDCAAGYKGKGE